MITSTDSRPDDKELHNKAVCKLDEARALIKLIQEGEAYSNCQMPFEVFIAIRMSAELLDSAIPNIRD